MVVVAKFSKDGYIKERDKRETEFAYRESNIPNAALSGDFGYMAFRIKKDVLFQFESIKNFCQENNYPRSFCFLEYSPWVIRDLLDAFNDYYKDVKNILQYISN